jgi:aminoglycoside phosphotransferase (APT) family kinase protein
MMDTADVRVQLASWFATQLGDAEDVRVEGLDRVEVGHSAETLLLTVRWRDRRRDHSEDVAVRIRPQAPGLLEPYDLKRQFDILRALETTPVRSPRALWFEGTGDVIGREFYVMERLAGTVYERVVPDELAGDDARRWRMCDGMVEQLAAIHLVDLRATGLETIGDGRSYLDDELGRWGAEIRRVQRGPLPALERLAAALHEQRPAQHPAITLVHGDAKPGNFAFEGAEVSAVFDWEMATVGDPMADIGWAEVCWSFPGYFTSLPGSLTTDDFVGRWEHLTGLTAQHREWYRAFQAFKMAGILLVGGHLFDSGTSDDVRFLQMTHAIHPLTLMALRELSVGEDLAAGPVTPRDERIAEVKRSPRQ